ncbi:hypothetical protein V6N11_034119 [Hibiscus sabdariffa]|uniref:RNase H type-1 domain-containing protein n=1 Tax=Hibiscus sabdariffa TaxID=183260 RepID=A0ABR2S1D8_9ROSI
MNLFASSSPTDAAWILDKVQAHVTTPMNAMLLEPFRKEEVWKVVKCMAPMKATGIDGFPALFYQTYWHIVGNDVVDFCPSILNEGHAAVESIEHVMKECTFIEGFLKAQGIHLVIYSADVSWKDRLALTFQGLSSIHKYALMVTFNTVWYARNKLVHEGLKPVLSNTLSFILASLKEYDMLQAHTCLMPTVTQLKWRASLENEVKVNFDSTFIQQSMRSVSGVICRDNEGFILAACSFMHLSVRDTFMAEALSCLQAITFAWELGFTRVVVEGDSRTVIMKCQSEDNDVSLITPEANMTAHIMAQEDKVFDCPMYWIEEAPPRTMLAAEKDRLAIAQG